MSNKINETHLCILRKEITNDNLKTVLFPLTFEFSDLMDELYLLSENDNRNVFDMEAFIQQTDLRLLKRDYNYCQFLSDAYQWIPAYQSVNEKDYNREKARLEKESLQDFIRNERKALYRNFKRRQLASALISAYNDCRKDELIKAHSHRMVGFTYPEFKLGEDFKVGYKTNFGYGNSSYFYTNISFRGIDIRPYSDWIKFRYANKIEIIRYTRRYPLQNEYWQHAMEFTATSYNHSINYPENFVKKWIINECVEMVGGLESLLNNNSELEVRSSFFNEKEKIILKGFDLTLFKGERISGALSFLDKISELKPICTEVNGFVERIMNCNLKVYRDMDLLIKDFNRKIPMLKEEEEVVSNRIVHFEELLNEFDLEKEKIIKELQIEEKDLDKNKEMIEELFIKKFPQIESYRRELEVVKEERLKLTAEIRVLTVRKDTLVGYNNVIEKYFEIGGGLRLA